MAVVVGMDLGYEDAQICYFDSAMTEPESISVLTGAEKFKIPTVLCKQKNRDYFAYGEEARRMALRGEGILIVDLLKLALENDSIYVGEESYETVQLLVIFVRKLWNTLMRTIGEQEIAHCVITVEETSQNVLTLLKSVSQFLPLEPEQISFQDYEESFYYYSFLQKREKIENQSMLLMEYKNQNIEIMELEIRGEKARIHKKKQDFMLILDEMNEISDKNAMDCQFLRILQEELLGKNVSYVFLLGDLFMKEWMKDSLIYLCSGRRVFKGNNLFVKGSAVAAMEKYRPEEKPYVYQGKNCLKYDYGFFLDEKKEKFYTLAEAGNVWFESIGEAELVLENQRELEIVAKDAENRICASGVVALGEYAQRRDFITAVLLRIHFESVKKAVIQITDLGFGEVTQSSGKVWTKVVEVWEE